MHKKLHHSFWALLVLFGTLAQAPAGPAGDLVQATSGQEERFAAAFEEIEKWIAQRAFPGAVLAVGHRGELLALKALGKMEYSEKAPALASNAIFDLASVSKVVGCTTAAAILYDRRQLDLEAPVIDYVPEFAGPLGHEGVLVRHLLSHSSGLQSPQALWRGARDRPGIMKQLCGLPLASKPGEVAQYRDYNMMLMGEIVYRISGQSLDQFLARNAFGPLGMNETAYNPPEEWIDRIPPTEQDDVLRHRLVRGIVHDENTFVMGGVSGHAGLFSSAGDLSIFAQMYLNGGSYQGKQILTPETIRLFSQRQTSPPGTPRTLGWDTPHVFQLLAGYWRAPIDPTGFFPGHLASPAAIMHTGFTGTSIYIDPQREAFIILLTNRVHPTRRNNLIDQARPAIYTAVLRALDRGRCR